MSISRVLSPIAIVVGVGIASVPVADVAYRIAGARSSEDLEGLMTSFGSGGYRLRPDVYTSADWYSGYFTVRTDALGLRRGDLQSTATNPGEHTDFVLIGDSQGFGHMVNFESSIVGELTRLASESDEFRWHFANLSVGGHHLRNQLELLKWLRADARVEYDHVVVLLTPYMISSAGRYNSAVVSSDGKLWAANPSSIQKIKLWAKTHTPLYSVLRNALHNVLGQEQAGVRDLIGFYETGGPYERRVADLRVALEELQTEARSAGADVRLVYTPLTLETDFTAVQRFARQAGLNVDVDAPVRQVTLVAEDLGLPIIHLRPALRMRAENGEPLSVRGDPHYNPMTNAACAQVIWSELTKDAGEGLAPAFQ